MEELLLVDLTQLLHNMRILRDDKCTLAGCCFGQKA